MNKFEKIVLNRHHWFDYVTIYVIRLGKKKYLLRIEYKNSNLNSYIYGSSSFILKRKPSNNYFRRLKLVG